MEIDQAVVEQMSKELARRGKIGRGRLDRISLPGAADGASDAQVSECKAAFMAGADAFVFELDDDPQDRTSQTADDME